jgi:O-antigen/teichoic acid export membrane protein
MWRDVTRWAMLGVVLTELAANCHAYVVTFVSGPGAFGLLALGALFMRPASLVLGALPDIDQPVMAQKIAAGDLKRAFGVVNEFRTAAGAVLAGTVLLAVLLVLFVPHLLLKHYAVGDVWIVLAFWAAITALRAVRTPESVFVMATGAYSKLAWISGVSGAVALAVTLVLLLAAGPIYALGGVAAGEVVMLIMLYPITQRWRAQRV